MQIFQGCLRSREKREFPWFFSSAELKEALEGLASVDVVSVALGASSAVCQEDGSDVTSVTFVTQHGDVPVLVADISLLIDDSNGGVSARYEGMQPPCGAGTSYKSFDSDATDRSK